MSSSSSPKLTQFQRKRYTSRSLRDSGQVITTVPGQVDLLVTPTLFVPEGWSTVGLPFTDLGALALFKRAASKGAV